MIRGIRLAALLTAVLAFFTLTPQLLADSDHDRAREALESGEILPLRTIIARLERDYPGQILEVELERDDDLWVYEIKLVRANGVLIKTKIDARDGRLLGVKGRDIAPFRQPRGQH